MKKINITIQNLFKGLGIDNNNYEKLQTVAEAIYIKTPENELVPILGFVKKKNNRIYQVELENGTTFKCSEKHIVITPDGQQNISCAELLLTTNGFAKIVNKRTIGEDDVYDVSLPAPHLYVTPNGIIHHNTSLAKIIVNEILDCQYLYINASDENSIDTVRGKIMGFAKTKSFDGKLKVVLLDEADQISADGQKALRNVMEEYASTNRFILTCNYLFKLIPAIQSRCTPVNLIPRIEHVVERIVEILKKEEVTIPQEQKPLLLEHIRKNLPDLRRIVNDIQKYSVNSVLDIKNNCSAQFAETIFNDIKNKKDIFTIRKTIIENEKEFSNDYQHLLKQIFEIVFKSDIDHGCKTASLLSISKGMELDALVVDKEINCFTSLLKLSQVLN
jgi:DNA polymerase III delta prime subunit